MLWNKDQLLLAFVLLFKFLGCKLATLDLHQARKGQAGDERNIVYLFRGLHDLTRGIHFLEQRSLLIGIRLSILLSGDCLGLLYDLRRHLGRIGQRFPRPVYLGAKYQPKPEPASLLPKAWTKGKPAETQAEQRQHEGRRVPV